MAITTNFDLTHAPSTFQEKLNTSLQQMSQIKLHQLMENHQYREQQRRTQQERNSLSKIFEQNGYAPQESNILSEMMLRDPKNIPIVMNAISNMKKQQGQQNPETGISQLAQQQPQGYQQLTPENTQMENMAPQGQVPQMASMRKPMPVQQPVQQQAPQIPQNLAQAMTSIKPMAGSLAEQKVLDREQRKKMHEEKMAFEEKKERRKITSKQEEDFDEKIEASKKQEETINEMLAFLPKARVGYLKNIMQKLVIGELLRNVPTQIVHAKLVELTQGARAAYDAARLSNLDVDLFSKSLENARNTREGITAIAKTQLRRINVLKYKNGLKRDIKEQNGGILPYDWKDKINIQAEAYSKYQWQETMNDLRRYSGK